MPCCRGKGRHRALIIVLTPEQGTFEGHKHIFFLAIQWTDQDFQTLIRLAPNDIFVVTSRSAKFLKANLKESGSGKVLSIRDQELDFETSKVGNESLL